MPTLAILEDSHEALEQMREAISIAPLGRQPDLVFHTTLCREMIAWLENHTVDVLICDLSLPDTSGLEAVRYCNATNPNTEIIVCTIFEDDAHIFESLKSGAVGYLLKADIGASFITAINQAFDGGSPMNSRIARRVLSLLNPTKTKHTEPILTEKEHLILIYMSRGYKNKEIADLTHTSPHTIHSHFKNIYRKLQVSSRTEALFEAQQLNILRAS